MMVLRLRSYLSGLLVATMLVTLVIVGSAILWMRIPQIEQANKEEVARDIGEMAALMEILLGSVESRVQVLSQALRLAPASQANALLDEAVGNAHVMGGIYLVSGAGRVLAAGLPETLRAQREDWLGSDLSANPLIRAAQTRQQLVWGDKYLSVLSGVVTVGLAYPVDAQHVLVAEVPLSYLLRTFQLAAGQRDSLIWLVDRRGEVLADTEGGTLVGRVNVLNLPLISSFQQGQALPDLFRFMDRDFHPAISRSMDLDWYFVGGMPSGLENHEIRGLVVIVFTVFLGALVVGFLLAPFWASRLIRPLRRIVVRAGQISAGEQVGPWPQGTIAEFNSLSGDLEKMAATLQERQQKSQAIFNTSPVAMSVTSTESPFALLDVNLAWCRVFRRRREDALGRTATELNMWRSQDDRAAMFSALQAGHATAEAWMLRGDGEPVLIQLSRDTVQIGALHMMVWAGVDITEMHRIDNALRELNAELEDRVARRTEALASANDDLSTAIAELRQTQTDLVRAEKMAALGGLVAGVAHELNTPLGNGLMAVTALGDEVRKFRQSMQDGLRRTALEALLSSVEQATDISTRNLYRAAELVTSFKQVAVDQTSAQRRRFALAEVVAEIVSSLRPSFARTPYKVVVEIPPGLWMDSYPGALGQVVTNLVNNAVLHGFEGRNQGTVHITGEARDEGWLLLRVADDGCGIPTDLLDRIFDPFVTTKMGRGGTGLGLHISYNAVVSLLGGSISVRSTEGEGAVFELLLPSSAPRAT